jgi:hypothetical protein
MASEKELSELRAVIRQRAGEEAAALEDQFAEKGLGFISPPPKLETKTTISGQKYRGGRGGEWDFFSGLSKAEKSRLRRNWTLPGGMQPDQFGIDDSITGQFRSVDEGIEEFLDLTRRIDVLKTYSKTGKLPSSMDAYGGLNLDSIFGGALGEIEMDMRVPVSISGLYGEDSLGYLAGLQADSAVAYGEELVDDIALPPRTQAQIKLRKIQIAKETKLNDIARREEKAKSTINVGRPLTPKEKLVQNRARAMTQPPVDEALNYAEKEAAGYFDDNYFNSMNEAAYADDVIESYEVLDGPIASIASSAKTTGAKVASAVAGKSSTASSTTSHIIKGVETATDLVSFNKKTAAAAAGLGLAGGYFANRKRTRR